MSTTAFNTPAASLARRFEHEQLLVHQDRFSGLKVVIALHSTAMGPALGGTRFLAYARDEDAVTDALNLSRGMSYKNAMAGIGYGGGKAVIIGDPTRVKTEELLLAYGRSVASLGGQYITGCDVGTSVADMDVVARTCRWVAGRSPGSGGAGDSSILAAFGVYQGMRAAAQHRWGDASLRDKLVGVSGVGKVGHLLVAHLVADDARVTVTDIDKAAVRKVTEEFPTVTVAEDTAALIRTKGMDIYAPCALGGALNRSTVPQLTSEVVCGAANNQLAYPEAENDLAGRGVLYVPDYVVNAGGAIQAAGAVDRADFEKRRAQTQRIFETTLMVLRHAVTNGLPPGRAADQIAEERIHAAALAHPRGATKR